MADSIGEIDGLKQELETLKDELESRRTEAGKAKDFFKNPLHPYSKALLESLPSNGLKPIPGQPPSMINPPEGCKFHPRCEFATEKCLKEPPFFEHNGNFVRCYLYD